MLRKIKTIQEKIESGRGHLYRVVSKNDSTSAQSHQMGLYIDKRFWSVCFDERCKKGTNTFRIANVDWYDGKSSLGIRFGHYGKGRKDEYRITRINRSFEIGMAIVLVRMTADDYYGFVLTSFAERQAFNELQLQKLLDIG